MRQQPTPTPPESSAYALSVVEMLGDQGEWLTVANYGPAWRPREDVVGPRFVPFVTGGAWVLRNGRPAFAGQTPDEMYFGRVEEVPTNLAAAHAHAREARMKANRSLTCAACRVSAEASPDTPDSLAISDPLQLHAEDSRMS